MQEILFFGASVILISASGVLSPGPLFASTVVYGLKENIIVGKLIPAGTGVQSFKDQHLGKDTCE